MVETLSSYADAEPRFSRWLEKYQRDRAVHTRARRAHADPVKLDADFAQVVSRMGIGGCYNRPAEFREATRMLLSGACASTEHFRDNEGFFNLGDIVDLLESFVGGRAQIAPEIMAFLKALAASGSAVILTNRRYVGNGGRQLPYFVLETAVIGAPWDYNYHQPSLLRLGSPHDYALRRACLRLLARMSFPSAERGLARGDTHPFMVLLETNRGGIHPFLEIRTRFLAREYRTNQAAFLQVLYLMIFMYKRFPWPRRQYLADVEHARRIRAPEHWVERGLLASKVVRMAILVPGFLRELVVDQNLWHVLAAYGFEGHNCSLHLSSCCVHDNQSYYYQCDTFERSASSSCGRSTELARLWNVLFSNRKDESSLIAMLRGSRLVSKWVCAKGRRPLLLEICRQRRRRVVQMRQRSDWFACAGCVFDSSVGKCFRPRLSRSQALGIGGLQYLLRRQLIVVKLHVVRSYRATPSCGRCGDQHQNHFETNSLSS